MMRGERRLVFCLLLGLFATSFSLGQSCTGTSCADCIASSSAAHDLECGFCYDTVGSSSFCANGTSYGPSGASCSCLLPKLSPKSLSSYYFLLKSLQQMIWFGISASVPVSCFLLDLSDLDISFKLIFVDPCTNQGVCVDCALGNVSQTSPSIIGSNLRPGFPGCGWCTSTNSCFSSSKAASCPGPASNFRNNLTANANPCSTARMYSLIIWWSLRQLTLLCACTSAMHSNLQL